MTEAITDQNVQDMLQDWGAYAHDQTQLDAMMAILQGWALGKAGLAERADAATIEAILFPYHALARQLLDTGGRMRLDPSGQLDASDQPLATEAQLEAISLQLRALSRRPADTGPASAGDALADMLALIRSLQAQLNIMGARLDEQAAQGDSIAAQLDALTGTVLAMKPQPAFAGLAALTETTAAALTETTAAAMTETIAAVMAPEPEPESDPAMLRGAVNEDGLRQPQWYPKAKPGCFYTADNQIICRTCGIPKDFGKFYVDQHMGTGRKSQCKQCEEAGKRTKKPHPVF